MRKLISCLALFVLLLAIPAVAQKAPKAPKPKLKPAAAEPAKSEFPPAPVLEEAQLRALKARSIGPAVMGGRVADIAYDPKDQATFYIALGTAGVMKSSNNGATFDAVFAKEKVAAVGAVAVAPSNPKVVYVGTGEANDRNSSAWGNGVYRSADGGETWTHAGLESSRTIARIVVHPTDPNTLWVAAMGDLWQTGGERGIFKSTDGGKTWKAVLAAAAPYDKRVGGGELAIDPNDPNVLYASLYCRIRTPWSFAMGPECSDGKDLGGIFKSTDGGVTWRKLEKGLPAQTGRIGLAVHAKDPKIVYALVYSAEAGGNGGWNLENKKGGVFRSEDGGESWTRMNALNPRPFYFSQIRVDPENDKRIYVLGMALHVSDNGGKTFREDLFEKVHPDLHALAIDPRNPKRLLLGTDGGAYQSWDAGKTWDHMNRFAGGEFYRINYDMRTPYRICGGLQDNINWLGPSRTYTKEAIRNADWIALGGGDGFYCVFDDENPDIIYTESQRGYVFRIDLRGGQMKDLRPEPMEGTSAYRFHWNAPLIGSRHQKGVLYLGGNRVFRLQSKGEHFDAISADLSTRDADKIMTVGSGAESYGVVYALAESPVKAGMLWAGTDDGKLWLTRDDGASWTDLTVNLPAPAKGQWISRVEPSHHDAEVAYLAVSAFRSGNFAPLAYRTADGGKTWQSIAGDLPADGSIKVVREDPVNANLLYAGTEFNLFVSLDRGGRWVKLGDLPTVAVDDILVHPRENDLLIATHGRSLYIIDDISPLQKLTTQSAAKDVHVFPPRKALAIHLLEGYGDWTGKAEFRGENPPEGALITFFLKQFTGDEVTVSIKNAADQPVGKIKAKGTQGLNRVNWDLKPSKELLTEYGGQGAKFLPAGEYTVTVGQGKNKDKATFTIEVAPGVETR